MIDQKNVNLYEAYASIYASQEELTEEVEIAAQYFHEMGLNEDGVDILIEELGPEEFTSFVYDIAEEYYLTEARAGGVKVEPVTAKGKPFKGGKPTGKSLERLRAKKAERGASEERASAEKPSGMKASLQRQSAIASAKKQQPKKKGVLDRVAGAVLKGIDRHNAAMGELKKMGAATRETAGKVGKAAGEFKKGFMGEEFETWVNGLVEEGYDLSEYTWDDMYEIYMEEVEQLDEEPKGLPYGPVGKGFKKIPAGKKRNKMMQREKEYTKKAMDYARSEGEAAGEDRQKMGRIGDALRNSRLREGVDLFDTILEHLVAEGYADTNEAALAIMANMSEEWRHSIVEGMSMNDFMDARKKRERSEKGKELSPTRRVGIHTPEKKPERDARRDAAYGETGHGGTLRPKKVRKAKALGELG
jgi:hypothetical protein